MATAAALDALQAAVDERGLAVRTLKAEKADVKDALAALLAAKQVSLASGGEQIAGQESPLL